MENGSPDATEEVYAPSTDLALSLAGVLLLLLVAFDALQGADLEGVREKQREFVRNYAAAIGYQAPKWEGLEGILQPRMDTPAAGVNECSESVIHVRENATFQTFYFGADLLFETNEAELKRVGAEALSIFLEQTKTLTPYLEKVQIEGHADVVERKTIFCRCSDNEKDTNTITKAFYQCLVAPKKNITCISKSDNFGNLRLGAQRAESVYRLLVNGDSGLDPKKITISIASFGEYVPSYLSQKLISDSIKQTTDSERDRIALANLSPCQKGLNRRVEVTLIYKTTKVNY
jgi:outer membrane protein OmpA-like peptidoglycan-associated protein